MQDKAKVKAPRMIRLSLSLIDEPPLAMRSEMSEDGLAQLMASMTRNGMINAIAVQQAGQRYAIIAGHRRYIAAQRLGWTEIDCKDYTGTGKSTESIKVAENLDREEVNDADIAAYLMELYEKHHYTMEDMVRETNRSESWVQSRLDLFTGGQEIFMALREGKLNLAQATALNRFEPAKQGYYLTLVLQGGTAARVIHDWLRQDKAMSAPQAEQQQPEQQPQQPGPLPGVVIDACKLCNGDNMPHLLIFVRVHSHCFEAVLQSIAKATAGG